MISFLCDFSFGIFFICCHTNLSFVVIFWWVCIQHFISPSNFPTDFVGAGVTGHWFTLPSLLPPCKTPNSNTSCVCFLEKGNSLESEIKDLHSSLIKQWRNRAVGYSSLDNCLRMPEKRKTKEAESLCVDTTTNFRQFRSNWGEIRSCGV